MKQLLKIIVGAVLGATLGVWAEGVGWDWAVRVMTTMQYLIGQLITFSIPLIIFFFITSGISSLSSGAGKLLGKTVGFSYLSTIFGASMAYFITSPLIPSLVGDKMVLSESAQKAFSPFFMLDIPPLMNVMTALVLSFVFGLLIHSLKLETLKKCVDEGKSVIETFLSKVIIPILPFFIAGEFCRIAAEGQAWTIAKTFLGILLVVIGLHFLWLTILYIIAFVKSKKSPVVIVKTMFPAYLTALGTMSSAATIPVTLRQTKKLGVRPQIADFTIPLCANVHLSGSAITMTVCSLALIFMTGHDIETSFVNFFPFILMLGVIMVAAPGAPGGAVLSALGIMQTMLHFSEAQCALMIALYLAQDSFGTACNVSGDGALSLLVNSSVEENLRS